MSCQKDMGNQIVARLSGAHSPIRDPKELTEALGDTEPKSLDLGELPLNVEKIVRMRSPRDYLSTNPWQVAGLVVRRADFPTHSGAVP